MAAAHHRAFAAYITVRDPSGGQAGSDGREGGRRDGTLRRVNAMPPQFHEALVPFISALEADGYTAHADLRGDVFAFVIKAGPDACEDCLSPRAIMEPILLAALQRSGFTGRVEVRYPAEAG